MPESAISTVSCACPEIRAHLSHYVRGNLSLQESRQVCAHLARCVGCRAVADGQQVAVHQPGTPRPLIIRATALTMLVVTFVLIRMIRPVGSQAVTIEPIREFSARPGTAYYVRLHVEDPANAQRAVTEILESIAGLQVDGPYSARYYLGATPEQLAALLRRLAKVGDPDAIAIGDHRWLDKPLAPGAGAVLLDLLPGESAAQRPSSDIRRK